MVLYLVIRSYLGMVTHFFGDIPMDHVKVGRLGPFPRVSKPVFLTSAILILAFIIFGALFNEQAEVVFNQAKAFVSLRFG